MTDDKQKLDHVINFRATEKLYNELMIYLKQTGETISSIIRQATYDYLKLKKAMEENGYVKNESIKEKKEEVKINSPPQEIMYCDSEHCEIDQRKMEKC